MSFKSFTLLALVVAGCWIGTTYDLLGTFTDQTDNATKLIDNVKDKAKDQRDSLEDANTNTKYVDEETRLGREVNHKKEKEKEKRGVIKPQSKKKGK